MAQFTIRIPDELRDSILSAAQADERSMYGEITWLLRVGIITRNTRKLPNGMAQGIADAALTEEER